MVIKQASVGKTLSASLLGKKLGKPVYRVDISQLVSKYIGETSKNLDKLFNLAEDQDWILFFDEGDALFGKRVVDFDGQSRIYLPKAVKFDAEAVGKVDFLASPNPVAAGQDAVVRLANFGDDQVTIRLVHISGTEAQSIVVRGAELNRPIVLNLSQVPAGAYFVVVSNSTVQITKRILVL